MLRTKTILLLLLFVGLLSFKREGQNYSITISLADNKKPLPKSFRIRIANNEKNEISLSNLVFSFYYNKGGFWGVSEKLRFVDSKLIIKPKQIFEKIIPSSSLEFSDFVEGKPLSLDKIEEILKNSSSIMFQASLSDMRLHRDPLSSSDRVSSNAIVIENP